MTAPVASGRALVPFVPRDPKGSTWLKAAALVVLFGLTAGVGGAATLGVRYAWLSRAPDVALQAALRGTKEQVAKLAAEVAQLRTAGEAPKPDDANRALKRSVEALKAEIDQLRTASTASGIQASTRLDRLERDPAGRVAELANRMDRLEHDAKADKPATVEPAREKAVATSIDKDPVASIPKPTGSTEPVLPVAPAKAVVASSSKLPATAPAMPVARPAASGSGPRSEATVVAASAANAVAVPVKGWVLRDVYDGLAVVQARGGELREIGPGEYLPGAGQVRAIERRGRGWVVLTSRGVIASAY